MQEKAGQAISEQKFAERMEEEDFGNSHLARVRKYLWNLTGYPETSWAAQASCGIYAKRLYIMHGPQAFAFTSTSVVIISTITFMLSTMPQLATDLDLILFDNKTRGEAELPVARWQKVRRFERFL